MFTILVFYSHLTQVHCFLDVNNYKVLHSQQSLITFFIFLMYVSSSGKNAIFNQQLLPEIKIFTRLQIHPHLVRKVFS